MRKICNQKLNQTEINWYQLGMKKTKAKTKKKEK